MHHRCVTKPKKPARNSQKLSPAKLRQVRDRLEDFLEDQLAFTTEFAAATKPSKSKKKSPTRPRKTVSNAKRRKT
jgi:hypothetical protein